MRKKNAARPDLMGFNKPMTMVEIGGYAFTVSGERSANGTLRFSVVDVDCALAAANDEMALQFQAALRRRLATLREQRREAGPGEIGSASSD